MAWKGFTKHKSLYGAVDPRLRHIIEETSRRLPEGWDLSAFSGYRGKSKGQHGRGRAVDVQLLINGKPVAHSYKSVGGGKFKGAKENYRLYEKVARTARAVQKELYPNLPNFRWGGGFSGTPGKTYGARDDMHFDFGSKAGMAAYDWDKGLSPRWAKAWGIGGETPSAAMVAKALKGGSDAPSRVAWRKPWPRVVEGARSKPNPWAKTDGTLYGSVDELPEPEALIPSTISAADERAIRTILGEGPGSEFTIANRIRDGRFGKDIFEITKPRQFETWAHKNHAPRMVSKNSKAYKDAMYRWFAAKEGAVTDPTGGALYFYGGKKVPSFHAGLISKGYKPISVGGNTFLTKGEATTPAGPVAMAYSPAGGATSTPAASAVTSMGGPAGGAMSDMSTKYPATPEARRPGILGGLLQGEWGSAPDRPIYAGGGGHNYLDPETDNGGRLLPTSYPANMPARGGAMAPPAPSVSSGGPVGTMAAGPAGATGTPQARVYTPDTTREDAVIPPPPVDSRKAAGILSGGSVDSPAMRGAMAGPISELDRALRDKKQMNIFASIFR